VNLQNGTLHVTYRKPIVYQAQETLLLTQSGFPYGAAVQGYAPAAVSGAPAVPLGDPNRLATLASLYTEIVNGDQIRRMTLGPNADTSQIAIQASTVVANDGSGPALPMLAINAIAYSPTAAVATARRASGALATYLKQSQTQGGIAVQRRVLLQVVDYPRKATVLKARKKTVPIVLFLLVMLMTLGLAFVLEHLRPQPRVSSSRSAGIPVVLPNDA
jgi:hypothetical protein